MWHLNLLREWTSVLGIVLILAALGSTFVFTSGELAEYELRLGHAGPIVMGVLGIVGILRRDRKPDDPP